MSCENRKKCSFFNKYNNVFVDHYHVMIQSYCLGALNAMCKRKEHEATEGNLAPDNLCPSGYYSKRREVSR